MITGVSPLRDVVVAGTNWPTQLNNRIEDWLPLRWTRRREEDQGVNGASSPSCASAHPYAQQPPSTAPQRARMFASCGETLSTIPREKESGMPMSMPPYARSSGGNWLVQIQLADDNHLGRKAKVINADGTAEAR